ncbi:hypothetical protein CQ12_13805 [Bradyrhizobium jicamae]|uniref:SMODS and SLOG-associating 2TM effector domain-containing protein n=1 Tax=Bradyrhizobium jicamae TaxID=280332 RepID=A0A0R3LVG9_9BRAD|nr:hypothetical protein [Bradyrhizobium jicamae]KRR09557.1 hypothetical protein CQ12_13805 [Bradyrhizobium jicamae]
MTDTEATSETNDDPRFNALRNSIYHTARREYYDTLNRLLNFVVIILGAGVAGKASKLFHIEELWLEFGVLIFATAQLTFDFGSKARTHEFLQRKYCDMLAEIELEATANPAKWNSKLFTIAGEEPMPMRALDALAYNAALDATVSDPTVKKENRLRVPFCHRLLRHFVARDGYEYRLESEPITGWQRVLNCFKS